MIEFILALSWPIKFVIVNFLLLINIFVWVMKLRDWVEGTIFEKPARIIIGIPAFAFDWYVNMFAASILFLDLPEGLWREVVTGRLQRYKKQYQGQEYLRPIRKWRLFWANYLCDLANKYDKGHC